MFLSCISRVLYPLGPQLNGKILIINLELDICLCAADCIVKQSNKLITPIVSISYCISRSITLDFFSTYLLCTFSILQEISCLSLILCFLLYRQRQNQQGDEQMIYTQQPLSSENRQIQQQKDQDKLQIKQQVNLGQNTQNLRRISISVQSDGAQLIENNEIIHKKNGNITVNQVYTDEFIFLNAIPEGMVIISVDDLSIFAINMAMMKMFDIKIGMNFLEVIQKLEVQKLNDDFEDDKSIDKNHNICENYQISQSFTTYISYNNEYLNIVKQPLDIIKERNSKIFASQKRLEHQLVIRDKSMSEMIEGEKIKNDKQSNIIIQILRHLQTQGTSMIMQRIVKNQPQCEQYGIFLTQKFIKNKLNLPKESTDFDENHNNRYLELQIYSALYKNQPKIVITSRDVSYRQYIKLLADQSKAKSNMISFVSHEFRNPLHCIITMLQASLDSIEQGDLGQLEQYLQIGFNNCQYLLSLANDLLDLAQIKVGKFKETKIRFDLKQLLKECLAMFELQVKQKNLKLIFEYPDNLGRFVYQDCNRIKQIVINLLGNALKFTLQGCITLRVQKERHNYIRIEVCDTGIGIKKSDQPKLFHAFGKVNSEESKRTNSQGVGLGLLISNIIAKNLTKKGLEFSSEYMKGSKFWFYIIEQEKSLILESCKELSDEEGSLDDQVSPYKEENLQDVSEKFFIQDKMEKLSGFLMQKQDRFKQNGHIMIVDDAQFNIEALKVLIRKILGKDIMIKDTISGVLAEKILKNDLQLNGDTECKMIFMDIEMPDQSGILTTIKINKLLNTYNKNIPIVGCSGYEGSEEKKNALESGMVDYITKPIKIESLRKVIFNLLNQH